MRVLIVSTVTISQAGSVLAQEPIQQLSPIDASPLLLKTVNCPSLKFKHCVSFDGLQRAIKVLLQEYPIIGGRIKKVTTEQISQHPHLKSAPYCIDTAAANAGVLLCLAETDAAAGDVQLNQALAAPFSMAARQVELPHWYQPLDISAVLQGTEPLLKIQLTRCTDGGSILAATMPHLLADSHSSTLLLTRLSELYKQLQPEDKSTNGYRRAAAASPYSQSSLSQPSLSQPSQAAAATAATSSSGAGDAPAEICRSSTSTSSSKISGVAFGRMQRRSSEDSASRRRHMTYTGSLKEQPACEPAATIAGASASGRAVSSSNTSWSKGLLLPQGYKEKQVPSETDLKALSLDLQSVDRPRLGSTLKWLGAAIREGFAASKKFPGATTHLTSCLINIPECDITQLKLLAAANQKGTAKRISTNDALSALAWITLCQLRGRHMPGTTAAAATGATTTITTTSSSNNNNNKSTRAAASSSKPRSQGARSLFASCLSPKTADTEAAKAEATRAGGALGMAIDLRQNCPDLNDVNASYFGNAAWCLHIHMSPQGGPTANTALNGSNSNSSSNAGGASSNAFTANGFETAAAAAAAGWCVDEGQAGYAAALQAAAGTVRGALSRFRQSKGVGNTLLQLVAAQQAAPASVLVRNLSRLAVLVDGFITSWRFPADKIDFGCGPAEEYCCVVRPTPPWQVAVLPGKPTEGSVQLLLTVPVSAVAALKKSPVLQQLVPHARFL